MKRLYRFFIKLFFSVILFLSLAIVSRSNSEYRKFIHYHLYENSFDYSGVYGFYNRYLGGVMPNLSIYQNKVNTVFGEKLQYTDSSSYYDGVKLQVSNHYLIPILEEGVVVYVGDKENYGYVVMIQNDDGVDYWYGNVCNEVVKLYDHVEAGSYLGEACGEYVYMVYTKGNEYLNYEDYL